MTSSDFIVARDDLRRCKLTETQLPDTSALPDDALLLKVRPFAFTANNITYAVLGDQLKYWLPEEPALPGAKPTWFFVPDRIRKRAREWGPGGVDQGFGVA
jgi:hypothetical protein